MMPERLGLDPATQNAVWVFWFDEPLIVGMAKLAAGPLACPECRDGRIDVRRSRGLLDCVGETPNCISASDRCPSCQAQLHFDATPETRRAALTWTRIAVGQ